MAVAQKSRLLRFSAVIITKDRPDDLRECLESVVGQTKHPVEIIMVIAGNHKPSLSAAQELCDSRGIALNVLLQRDGGIARARNLGARSSRGEVVCFVDDDTVLEPDYLEKLEDIYNRDRVSQIGGVSGVPSNISVNRTWDLLARLFMGGYHYSDGRLLQSGYFTRYTPLSTVTRVWHLGVNMSFRRVVFESLAFDEDLNHNEDVSFSYVVSKFYVLVATPFAKFVHKERHFGGGGNEEYKAMRRTYDHYVFFNRFLGRRKRNLIFLVWSHAGHILGYFFLSLARPSLGNRLKLLGTFQGNIMIVSRILRRTVR